jgi:cytochrome c556
MITTQIQLNPRRRRPHLVGVGLTIVLIISGAVYAHGNATGVVKERMDMMEKLGKSMKTLKALVRSQSEFDAGKVAELAEGIQEVSNHVGAKFPEGSNEAPSEALPSIWEDWNRFDGLIEQMNVESAKLGEIAREGDQRSVMRQFVALGKTCKGCHTDFRKKKDQ